MVRVEDAGEGVPAGVDVEAEEQEEERPGSPAGVLGRELPVLEDQADDGIPEHDEPHHAWDQQERHEAQREGKGRFHPFRRLGRHLFGQQREERHGYARYEET